ncbi:ATP-binding cassette domain-containing protein [Candidatus Methylopumilus planktonicus]|uniref:ABC transporter ATP-binding protein n=1 Tax=Candidatus Methylopumilus planktonicus TaxID=1581557 RepID=UPI00111D9F9B|nr:ATP-binding cassette domain-containing protein [Candidatus Methylopumilus planktonicus]QDD06620.1 ATP-binding cassette domain-containing protein [Candidatus Methylopumilus planktonicus]QDD07956.1 ATP-binding cassette domain-containing protein [Candidatus Methylopumilus planktonicus]QDD09281.1 ATP-binding cassette domain-containing protein [Candidatus Methylopumilus planktonicus]
MTKKLLIACKDLSKTFPGLDEEIIKKLNLNIKEGDHTAIVGVSGSGKSTLLHLMAGLEKASSGQIEILDQDISFLNQDELGVLRNTYLGFVYQFHHLLSDFNAIENVAMPLLIRRYGYKQAFKEAEALLKKIGLSKRLTHKPSELSGGERQRVAIARSLITKPKCILADEPTGNLDGKTAHFVFDLLLDLAKEDRSTLVLVTHDIQLASKLKFQYKLNQGKLKKT